MNSKTNFGFENMKNKVMSTASNYETNVIAAIEEEWALFLRALDDGRITL